MKRIQIKKQLQKSLNEIRSNYSCVWETEGIKPWEYIFLVFGCYLKEIIEVIIATIAKNKYLSILAPGVYPLNMELFWIIIFKVGIGLVILMYFHYKYVEKTIIWFVLIFWLFSVGQSLLSWVSKFGHTWNEIMQFFQLMIQFFIVVFFFAIDKSNLDSLKLLVYDRLDEDPFTGRLYKSPWSKISSLKISKLIAIIFAITISTTFIISIIFAIIKQVVKGIGITTPTAAPNRNQQMLEQIAKQHLFYIGFTSIIMAPIMEETIFRKCLMQMSNYRWWTAPISAFIFATIHLHNEPLWSIFPYLIPGFIFSTIMLVSKNIWFSILSHGLFNTVSFINMAINISK